MNLLYSGEYGLPLIIRETFDAADVGPSTLFPFAVPNGVADLHKYFWRASAWKIAVTALTNQTESGDEYCEDPMDPPNRMPGSGEMEGVIDLAETNLPRTFPTAFKDLFLFTRDKFTIDPGFLYAFQADLNQDFSDAISYEDCSSSSLESANINLFFEMFRPVQPSSLGLRVHVLKYGGLYYPSFYATGNLFTGTPIQRDFQTDASTTFIQAPAGSLTFDGIDVPVQANEGPYTLKPDWATTQDFTNEFGIAVSIVDESAPWAV